MKKIFLSLAFVAFLSAPFLTSCGGSKTAEGNPETDSLTIASGEKDVELAKQKAALGEFITSFNEIQANLNEIKEKEKIISKSTGSVGDAKNKEDQIKEDIQSIYDLLNKNKARISSLNKKLKNANVKINGLEQMIESLEAQLMEKDTEIASLKSQIEGLNIELSNLNLNYQEAVEESEAKTEKINTVYYAVGTSKELKEKGVITKEGGFIGLGKTSKLKNDFNKDYFTKSDASKLSSIAVGGKNAKVLTNHPSSSFKLNTNEKKFTDKLEISNIEEFWSSSKYLVIVID